MLAYNMKKNVFITGAGGCVGHYLFDLLVNNPDYQLILLVRSPQKLKFNPAIFSNVRIIHDELKNIKEYDNLLREVDYLIHVAAGWGETEANYNYTIDLFNLLDPNRVKKVICFSTASILGENNKVFDKVDEIGTSYVRGKYLCYKKLPELKIYDRIITLFPTWVLGGDDKHPYSHASMGIKQATKWLWLLRFLSTDVSFHFIHAYDIAQMVNYLLGNDVRQKEFVLGNPLITADQFIKEMCACFSKNIYFRIRISPDLVSLVLRKRLSAWDKYCLGKKHFEYDVVSPQNFGLKSQYSTVKSVVLDAIK